VGEKFILKGWPIGKKKVHAKRLAEVDLQNGWPPSSFFSFFFFNPLFFSSDVTRLRDYIAGFNCELDGILFNQSKKSTQKKKKKGKRKKE